MVGRLRRNVRTSSLCSLPPSICRAPPPPLSSTPCFIGLLSDRSPELEAKRPREWQEKQNKWKCYTVWSGNGMPKSKLWEVKDMFCNNCGKHSYSEDYCNLLYPEEELPNFCHACKEVGYMEETCWKLHLELKANYLQEQREKQKKWKCHECGEMGHARRWIETQPERAQQKSPTEDSTVPQINGNLNGFLRGSSSIPGHGADNSSTSNAIVAAKANPKKLAKAANTSTATAQTENKVLTQADTCRRL
jgi:hypothetical protein